MSAPDMARAIRDAEAWLEGKGISLNQSNNIMHCLLSIAARPPATTAPMPETLPATQPVAGAERELRTPREIANAFMLVWSHKGNRSDEQLRDALEELLTELVPATGSALAQATAGARSAALEELAQWCEKEEVNAAAVCAGAKLDVYRRIAQRAREMKTNG